MTNNGLWGYASSLGVDPGSSSERYYDHHQAAHNPVVRSTGVTEPERGQSPPPLPPKVSSAYHGVRAPLLKLRHFEEILLTRPQGSVVVSDESGSPPPPRASSSNHEVRALVVKPHLRLLIKSGRPAHEKEMLSSSAKAVQGKVQSSMQ
jgi:hypothetical protein